MLKTVKYIKYHNYLPISLDGIYKGEEVALNNLKDNIKSIIEVEAPITLNTLKARLREAFRVKKISQKALDIVLICMGELDIDITDNLYDIVYWSQGMTHEMPYLRIDSNRQIYDIPHQELKPLVKELNLSEEELYRAILNFFGYEVLTEKARVYLEYIEKMTK